jgi:hypothetical protein
MHGDVFMMLHNSASCRMQTQTAQARWKKEKSQILSVLSKFLDTAI